MTTTTKTQPKPSAVRIDDSAYYFAHGKAPRGFGSWAFGPQKNTDCMECKFFSGTVAEAKKAARIWAASEGIDTLYTQS